MHLHNILPAGLGVSFLILVKLVFFEKEYPYSRKFEYK